MPQEELNCFFISEDRHFFSTERHWAADHSLRTTALVLTIIQKTEEKLKSSYKFAIGKDLLLN